MLIPSIDLKFVRLPRPPGIGAGGPDPVTRTGPC